MNVLVGFPIHSPSSCNLRGHGIYDLSSMQAYFCLLSKLATFTPFAMHGIVSKLNNIHKQCAIGTDHVVLEMGPCSNG